MALTLQFHSGRGRVEIAAMTYDLALALIGFAFVSSITPGPNNLMLMASGANFGLTRTVPHMLGVSFGHAFLVLLVGLGLAELFQSLPWLRRAMMALSAGYLLFLAWKIANAAAPGEGRVSGNPLTFLQAAAFQWVNPKAIYMGITAQTYYAPGGGGWIGAAWVAGLFLCTNLPSVSVWAWGGTQVRRWLSDQRRLRMFNWTMAALLVLTLVPILRG